MTEETKNLTIIDSWTVPTREERETILNFEDETQSWHIYTDVPKHARKYEKFIDQSKPHRKGYSKKGGALAMLEGYITGGNVNINKRYKSKMTDEQREQASKRLAELRKKQNA